MNNTWKQGVVLFLMTIMIIACGGGGGSDYSVGGSDMIGSSVGTDPQGQSDMQIGGIIDEVFQPGRLALSIDENQVLAHGSTLTVSALIVDALGNPYATPILVSFESTFASLGLAEIDLHNTTVNGEANAVYKVTGGQGTDTISAHTMIDGETLSATATLKVAGSAAMHIDFVSASHPFIALRNTGGPPRSETSVLTFKVVDISGTPVAGQTVDFRLSTEIGDLYLSTESDVSDASGLVRTTVNAGTVSTEIKVHATVRDSDPLVTVVSDTLIISTGLADQNSISLSVDTFNPEGWNYNNVEVKVVFQAADHFNNFVPDGTVVYFTTELGSIDESCTLKDGVCTAIWRSGNPRESYCDDLTPACQKAMSTITAFLFGEESFTDFNGNGYFDAADAFDIDSDMGEPFRDDNDSGDYQDFEPWWDFNTNGIYDGPNGIYNGSLCSKEAEDSGLCAKDLVYVRESTSIVMSGSFAATFTLTAGQGSVILTIADSNGNPMPEGSKVEILSASDDSVVSSFEIPSTLFGTVFSVRVSEAGSYYGRITTPFNNISVSDNTVTIN